MRSSLTIAVYLATAATAQASSFVALGVATETPSVVAISESSIQSVAEAETTPSVVAFAEPAQTIPAEPAIVVAAEEPERIEALPAIETVKTAALKITPDPNSMFAVLSPSILVAGLEDGQSFDLAALDIATPRKPPVVLRAGIVGSAYPNTGSPESAITLPGADANEEDQQAATEDTQPALPASRTEDLTDQPALNLPAPPPQDAPAMPSLPFPGLAPSIRE